MAASPTRWGETPGEPQKSTAKPGSRGRAPHQSEIFLPVRDYDLAATLDSGQVFRWKKIENSWHGVVGKNFARLTETYGGILAETSAAIEDLDWLRDFLQIKTDLAAILKTFPDDEPMRAAIAACRGLRLLRQEPWECLASFILSSTKQIVQIRQIVALLCERFGEPTAFCSSPTDLIPRFPWMSGLNARCNGYISRAAAPAGHACAALPPRISARTPVTPSNIFFITCGRN
jgi:hypothetical protein